VAARKVSHGGKDYTVVPEQLPNGKWIARIDPDGGFGQYIRNQGVQTTDPSTGRTTTKPGKPTEFDSELGALNAGEENVKFEMI